MEHPNKINKVEIHEKLRPIGSDVKIEKHQITWSYCG